MIFNNMENLKEISFLDSKIMKALDFAMNNDLINLKLGTHKIDKDIYFNKINLLTKDESEGFWEGHKEYIDIHLILKGREKILYNQNTKLKFKSYLKESDFALFEGKKAFDIILEAGDFVIFYPEDIHKTGIKIEESNFIEKIIFKIKL